jgi:hypothetical protein
MNHLTPNSRTTQIVAGCVLGGITLAGMYFNARYAVRLGHTLDEKIVLGIVSVAFDAAKVLAFCYAMHHLCRLSFLRAALAGIIWMLTASYAMYAAGSYAFGQLAHAQHAQEIVNKELRERAVTIARLEKDVEDAKQAKNTRGHLIWASSGSCLSPTTPESTQFCHAYFIKLGTLNDLREKATQDKRTERVASPELMEWSKITGLSVHDVMIAIALIFALIIEVVASVSGFAFARNARDIQDDVAAEQRRRNHERRMAQIQAARERNQKRNELARERRAERKAAPMLHVVR